MFDGLSTPLIFVRENLHSLMRSSKTLPNKRTRDTKLQVATDKGTAFREKLKKEKLLHVKEWEVLFFLHFLNFLIEMLDTLKI